MDELISAIEELGMPVYDTDATGASLALDKLPYLLIYGTDGEGSAQRALCGDGTTDEITIRHVGASAQQVRLAARRTRAFLKTGGIAGFAFELEEVRAAVTDTSVLLEGTDRHPVFLDHVWRAWK